MQSFKQKSKKTHLASKFLSPLSLFSLPLSLPPSSLSLSLSLSSLSLNGEICYSSVHVHPMMESEFSRVLPKCRKFSFSHSNQRQNCSFPCPIKSAKKVFQRVISRSRNFFTKMHFLQSTEGGVFRDLHTHGVDKISGPGGKSFEEIKS